MIKAESRKWARVIFNPYEERLLKKNFTNFYITGSMPEIDPSRSLIITPNHISWWDGFFIDYVSRKFVEKKFHILMLEEQLRRFSFFRNTGAFSINPKSVKGINETFNYARELLREKNNMIVFYPQGVIEPVDKKPDIKSGLFNLLEDHLKTDVLTAAFRIEYSNQKKPAVYFRPGDMIACGEIRRDYNIFRNKFSENINRLNEDVHAVRNISDIFKG
jgi:1-acyl-sn-glycerol-3-phosphate acyltransferase